FRVALFFASTALAGVFSGLLAAAISHLDGRDGRPGWAYIFILEGCFTIFFGQLCFFIMPRSLQTIKLLTAEEKSNAHTILLQECETLTSLAYFQPSIVQSLGFKANQAQLMSVPPYAVAWAVNIITAVMSDKFISGESPLFFTRYSPRLDSLSFLVGISHGFWGFLAQLEPHGDCF
ncbi:hypothetical protein MPER_07951, partial [Moniliophthora perniciosa FA553]